MKKPKSVALVQSKGHTTSSPTLNMTLDQAPQNGNGLIAVVQWVGNRGPVMLGGVEADIIVTAENGLRKVGIFAVHNISSATINCSVSDDDESAVSMHVFEVAGLANAAPQATSTATGNGNAMTTGEVDPSSVKNFVVGGMVGGGNGYTDSNISPSEIVTTEGNASMYGFCIGYVVRNNDDSAITMTRGLTIGGPWASAAAVFAGT